jgi:hypothetical protein
MMTEAMQVTEPYVDDPDNVEMLVNLRKPPVDDTTAREGRR